LVGKGFGGMFHCLISASSLTTDKQRMLAKNDASHLVSNDIKMVRS